MNKQEVLEKITQHYLTSGDFNGITKDKLGDFNIKDLEELILEDKIFVLSQRTDINIFIIRLDFNIPKEKQINSLRNERLVTIYPTKEHLKTVDIREEKPFTKMLAEGAEQLRILYFNVDILQMYYDNPLYKIFDYGYRGYIHVIDDTVEDDLHSEYIKDFGVAYPSEEPYDADRAVGVFLRDLSKLNYEAQCKWRGCLLRDQDKFLINKGFIDNLIRCDWVSTVWIFDALLEEIKFINSLCKNIGFPPLFKEEFSICDDELIGYRILLIPSKKNYYEFVTSLEKLLVNNLNCDFFTFDKIPYIIPIERKNEDGTFKGTIVLIEEWMNANYFSRSKDSQKIFKELVTSTLRKIRKIRQVPAHDLYSNQHDKTFYREQNHLITEVYDSIKELRLIFQHHPKNQGIKIPDILENEENIVLY